MRTRSIKTNYILNLSRLLLSTGIGLLTMPYVNKILGSVYIGKVEYVNAVINYFVLFSALGIPTYGIREIAKVRSDQKLRTKVLLELFIILIITTLISYVIIYILLIYFNFFIDVKALLVLMSTGVFLSNIGVEWFYQGIEDQLYISIRHIVVKVITVILLFNFVESKNDYIVYGGIMIFSVYGGNLFNLFHLKKFIAFNDLKWSDLEVKKHLKPVFIVFIATASISLYTQISIIILKYFTKDEFVAYYTQADKLSRIALVFITSLGAVMLPRLTYLYENMEMEGYARYAEKSFKFILLVSIPICTLFIIYSQEIIMIMAGKDFLQAITTLKITSLNIFIVGIAYFFGFQILYPLNKERIYTISVTCAAVISLMLNILIVSQFKHNGVALSSVVAEIIGVILMFFFTRKNLEFIGIKLFTLNNFKYFIAILVFIPISLVINLLKLTPIENVILGGLGSIILYLIILILLKEDLVKEIIVKIWNRT